MPPKRARKPKNPRRRTQRSKNISSQITDDHGNHYMVADLNMTPLCDVKKTEAEAEERLLNRAVGFGEGSMGLPKHVMQVREQFMYEGTMKLENACGVVEGGGIEVKKEEVDYKRMGMGFGIQNILMGEARIPPPPPALLQSIKRETTIKQETSFTVKVENTPIGVPSFTAGIPAHQTFSTGLPAPQNSFTSNFAALSLEQIKAQHELFQALSYVASLPKTKKVEDLGKAVQVRDFGDVLAPYNIGNDVRLRATVMLSMDDHKNGWMDMTCARFMEHYREVSLVRGNTAGIDTAANNTVSMAPPTSLAPFSPPETLPPAQLFPIRDADAKKLCKLAFNEKRLGLRIPHVAFMGETLYIHNSDLWFYLHLPIPTDFYSLSILHKKACPNCDAPMHIYFLRQGAKSNDEASAFACIRPPSEKFLLDAEISLNATSGGLTMYNTNGGITFSNISGTPILTLRFRWGNTTATKPRASNTSTTATTSGKSLIGRTVDRSEKERAVKVLLDKQVERARIMVAFPNFLIGSEGMVRVRQDERSGWVAGMFVGVPRGLAKMEK